MRFFTLLIVLLFAVQLNAQEVEGYYITESGKRVSGFFKYEDFFDTPALKFKESKKGEFAGLPQDVAEYGMIEDNLKFEKHLVEIDISGNDSYKKNPVWSKQTIFLNVLVSGNATLYSYTKDYRTFFFLSTAAKPKEINQLVYKKYKLSDDSVVENSQFRQQLYNDVICKGQKVSDFSEIKYDKKELTDVFKNYNECSGSKSLVYGPKKKANFKYSLFAGIHSMSLGVDYVSPEADNESSFTYSGGAEVSYVFPSETWGLYARAEFESLNSKISDTYDKGYNVTEITYKVHGSAFSFMAGPRYHFLLSNSSNIYLETGFCMSQPFGSIERIETVYPINDGTPYAGDNREYDLTTSFALNFGAGYSFKKKYAVAFRVITKRDFLEDVKSTSFKTSFSRMGLAFIYTLN